MTEYIAEVHIGEEFRKRYSLCYSDRPVMEQIHKFIGITWKDWFKPSDFENWYSAIRFYMLFDSVKYEIDLYMQGVWSIYSPKYSGLWQGGLDWMIRELQPSGLVQCDESTSLCRKVYLEYSSTGEYTLHGE